MKAKDETVSYPHATFARAVERYGLAKFAAAIGESVNSVCNWRTRGVPANRALAASKLLGLSVRTLRPDDWWQYWPPVRRPGEPPTTATPPTDTDTSAAA